MLSKLLLFFLPLHPLIIGMEFLYSSIDDNSPRSFDWSIVEFGYFSRELIYSIYGKIDTSYDWIYEIWEMWWLLDNVCFRKWILEFKSCPLVRLLPFFIKISCHSYWGNAWCPECKIWIASFESYLRHVEMISVDEEWETEFTNIIISSAKFATVFQEECEHDACQHEMSCSRHDEQVNITFWVGGTKRSAIHECNTLYSWCNLYKDCCYLLCSSEKIQFPFIWSSTHSHSVLDFCYDFPIVHTRFVSKYF